MGGYLRADEQSHFLGTVEVGIVLGSLLATHKALNVEIDRLGSLIEPDQDATKITGEQQVMSRQRAVVRKIITDIMQEYLQD